MGEIKSAREIAMEKLASLGEVTPEERLKWKYVPEGEKLAAGYIKGESSLSPELSRYDESAKKYVIRGALEILVRNIDLPKNDGIRMTSKKAMEGIKALKSDKAATENIFSKIRRLFDHYTGEGDQQRNQAYESLKAEFGARVEQALQQQYGTSARLNVDVESQPKFQEEWLKLKNQLDNQYLKLLDEYKQELLNLP